jgi:hypothetical protein
MRHACRETGIPNVAVWQVLQKRLHWKVYKLSDFQKLLKDKDIEHHVYKEGPGY